MNDTEFDSWLLSHSINPKAARIIQQIRTRPPARNVNGGKGNVTGRYPSKKMGHTIQFESHKVELAFIKEYEFDENVLEYYDQPGPIKISYYSAGRKVSPFTTPDFFVINKDGTAGWEECKTEQELERQIEKSERFQRNGSGAWRCPSGEEYAAQYKLYFKVRSSSEINWIWQRNIEYLHDYLQASDQQVPTDAKSFLTTLISCRQGILVSELANHAGPYTMDDLFMLIARGELYVDLHTHPLSEQDRTPVYIAREQAALCLPSMPTPPTTPANLTTGSKLVWDGRPFEVVNYGTAHVWLQNEQDQAIQVKAEEFERLLKTGTIRGIATAGDDTGVMAILQNKNPSAIAEANKKYSIILPYLSGMSSTKPTSTIYDWLKRFREAQAQYGNGFIGLLDRKSERGNRNPKLPARSYALMQSCIEEHHLNSTQTSPVVSYGHYVNNCEHDGVTAASFKTFNTYLKRLDAVTVEKSRKGPRAAYQLEDFHWELELTTPRHGERPFEIGHLDHTELDIELVDSTTGKNLGRPWLSLLIDAYSRLILAFVLWFESPSYRSCMMILRECVRLHGRLPQTIIVDGGSEFRSAYFEQLIAFHNMIKKNRPRAAARFGSVLERLFGTTNQQFVHQLVGNTQIMKNVRQVSKSVNPANLAVWTLARLTERIASYFSDVYGILEHPTLGDSPRNVYERGMFSHGMRAMKAIHYDDAFLFTTLPTTPRGRVKVIRSRGIKLNNFYYWHPRLSQFVGDNLPVRYDPFDIGTAYVFAAGSWLRCISQFYPILKGRTEKERAEITQEIHKRRSLHNGLFTNNAQLVAAFISETKDVEAELKQMRQAAQTRECGPARNDETEVEVSNQPPPDDETEFELYEELTL